MLAVRNHLPLAYALLRGSKKAAMHHACEKARDLTYRRPFPPMVCKFSPERRAWVNRGMPRYRAFVPRHSEVPERTLRNEDLEPSLPACGSGLPDADFGTDDEPLDPGINQIRFVREFVQEIDRQADTEQPEPQLDPVVGKLHDKRYAAATVPRMSPSMTISCRSEGIFKGNCQNHTASSTGAVPRNTHLK